jgi:hypothetical protein
LNKSIAMQLCTEHSTRSHSEQQCHWDWQIAISFICLQCWDGLTGQVSQHCALVPVWFWRAIPPLTYAEKYRDTVGHLSCCPGLLSPQRTQRWLTCTLRGLVSRVHSDSHPMTRLSEHSPVLKWHMAVIDYSRVSKPTQSAEDTGYSRGKHAS